MSKKYLNFSEKISLFILGFSILFYWIHVSGNYNAKIIIADLGGVPWLYSSLVTLFSIIAGFIIQKEWDNWNNLVDAVKSEINALSELWLWSRHLPEKIKDKFDAAIKAYLKTMAADGLQKSEQAIPSEQIEKSFSTMQEIMYAPKTETDLLQEILPYFSKLMEIRGARIRYSSHHVPQVLHNTLLFATFLLIVLSMFIGIKNIWLDYTFTLSVALTTFTIYLVIDDMDNPLEPGGWHLTGKDYAKLLEKLEKTSR